jgi:3-methyladenine DNA glycosylase AlkD
MDFAAMKRELIVGRLAQRFGLRPETVWKRLDEVRRTARERPAAANTVATEPPAVKVEAPPATSPVGDRSQASWPAAPHAQTQAPSEPLAIWALVSALGSWIVLPVVLAIVALVLGLWGLPHREEKYLALDVAGRFRDFVDTASLPLYRRLIVEGAWWDFVDEVATHLVGHLVVHHPAEAWPEVDTWIGHPDMWLRRSAIICQVGAKERTDAERLFSICEARIEEKEFFIRKAIGWSLREYAKTDPEAVAEFAKAHRGQLSGLSFREATKHIQHLIR